MTRNSVGRGCALNPLLEGPFTQLNMSSFKESGTKRSYILKLSEYNNTNPEQRNYDLLQIGEIVKTRIPKYTNEAL